MKTVFKIDDNGCGVHYNIKKDRIETYLDWGSFGLITNKDFLDVDTEYELTGK